MAEKVTSMRLNDEDLEQFKAFAKDNGLNQQQAFNSLIALAELEKAKDVLGTRATSIDSFRSTVTTLINFYVNSLEENTTTEQTIREELSKELQTKDNTITNLYEQLQELKSDKINSDNNFKDIDNKNKELQEQLQRASNDNIEKSKSIDKLNSNNDLLQENLQEYKQYKEQYKALEKELDRLKTDNEKLDTNKTLLETTIIKLQDKINNDADMIDFYKNNISELKSNIDQYKGNIKELETKHKSDVLEVKELFQGILDGRTDEHQEQLKKIELEFKDKLDFEIQKKQLEIDKLKKPTPTTKK